MSARNHFRGTFAVLVLWLIAAMALSSCFWDDDRGETTFTTDPATAAPVTPPPTRAAPTVLPTNTPVPTGPSPDLAAAEAIFREGRYGEARTAFQQLAERSPRPAERTGALIGAGKAAFELNDEGTGFSALEQAVDEAPPGSEAAVRAGYLYLKHLNEAGRASEAAAYFREDPALAEGSTIDAYFRHEGARALAAKGETGAADDVWAPLLVSSLTSNALKAGIYGSQADTARADDDAARLSAALDGLVATNGDPGARFERAQLALDAGDSDTFADQLRIVVARNPSSRFALQAIEALDEHGFDVNPGEAGLVYYRRGLYEDAKRVLGPAVEAAPSADALAFRAFYLAASYEDTGDGDDAIHYYDIAAASGGSADIVHRARYWAARVSEGMGTIQDASARYVSLATAPAGEFTEEAAFRAGYVLYEDGDSTGALAAWAGLTAGSARLEYWRGRALAEAGDAAGATAAYQRAVELGPLDLHGIESARRLGQVAAFDVSYLERKLDKPIDWAAIASWLSERVGGGASDTPPTAACELMSAGLRAEAAAEIWAAADGTSWRTFETMREASICGLTDVAAQLAVSLRGKAGVPSHEPPKDLLRVSYPVNYGATLANESRKAGVDPLFFASLIRQESFWDPRAHSPANAFGLTQVIPPTGEAIAAELGVAEFDPEDLYRPALSLEFGASYLGGQLRHYGNPLVALSAYNAGPGNATRWGAADAATPADLVEVIDFVETKNYVTFIFEAYAHYKLAWGD